MSFSPIQGSAKIEKQYKRYLSTMFKLDDPIYQKQFDEQIGNHSTFAAGPYLDVHDHFASGKTTRELVAEGVLPQSFLKFRFYHDRPLYSHQEEALRKALSGENIVVSTGTGSGKTESFLMPILASLAKEAEEGTLGPGVRALLVYPMNALANDQVERMRELLADTPNVTFGCYTGQTKNDDKHAFEDYYNLNKKEPASNELISRDQMKKTPPHLLITNYAMLEYLLVRPGDMPLFEGGHWRFVVMDEAHVYRGSTGIEVAMLLRRLRATLDRSELQYFLTSATLGDESENQEVAEFASDLCNSSFTPENIIRAIRIAVPLPDQPIDVPFETYRQIQRRMEEQAKPEEINRELIAQYPQWNLDRNQALFDLVRRDERYWRIRNLLHQPSAVSALAEETGMAEEDIECFVAVASTCEANGIRLLDARYHTFLRATDSVFITLAPSSRLFLNRAKTYKEPKDGQTYQVFEVSSCSSCHSLYLTGQLNEGSHCLDQVSSFTGKDIFYLGKTPSMSDEDTEEEENAQETGTICALCGYFRRDHVRRERNCEHDAIYQIPVVHVKTKGPSHKLKKCVHCDAVNNYGILRSFFTGQEAVTSVIATSLFEALPSQSVTAIDQTQEEDDFGFGFDGDLQPKNQISQIARQFLCFSDSRQASAYFATYLDTSYRKLLYKRLLHEQLTHQGRSVPLQNFCEDLSVLLEKKRILAGTDYRPDKESWKALLSEMADGNNDTSLTGMGMMSLGLRPESLPANMKLHLTGAEVTDLFNILLNSMLTDLAITLPCAMTEEDREFYAYGASPVRYDLAVGDSSKNLKSFAPKNKNRSNKRSDYIIRMLKRKSPDLADPEMVKKLMASLWNNLVASRILSYQDDGYQIDFQKIFINQPTKWYRCSKCGKLTPYQIAGVCPTYQCNGTLTEAFPDQELAENHYYRLAHDMDLQTLRVREHTAQLSRDMAYQYQQDFKNKKIDVLSCSTTFEMGVDVGSLETVFMRNMPPMPSNYAQRAGRAGRSKNSAAFALTFCNRASHDFSFFNKPEEMISGKIHAPHFNLINEKIAIRHLYASALAYFWRKNPDLFSTVQKMADVTENTINENGYEELVKYLQTKPENLKEFLKDFLPAALYERFDCENYGWINGLLEGTDGSEGILTAAVEEHVYEVGLLEEARKEAYEAHRSTGYLEQRLKTYRQEDILSFLSRKNIMPQYGFPIDTVPLTIVSKRGNQTYGVELQRDLAMAISEYAPGSQVVANGELFTGRYIKKVPKIGWKMYDYIYCEHCGTLNIDPHTGKEENDRLQECKVCGDELGKSKKTFIIPSFGFEIDPNDIRKPGLIRPEKTYRTDVYYVGYRSDLQTVEQSVGHTSAMTIFSEKDEMAILNKSDFHVCELCGYAESGAGFVAVVPKEHMMPSGKKCIGKYLRRYSLGYRFETDVFQICFQDYPLEFNNLGMATSVLYALMRGIVHVLDLEDSDISGCLQTLSMEGHYYYGLIYYDATPGGAGHVRRLQNPLLLEKAVQYAYQLMTQCTCGDEEGHASCYACLRSYQNQKYHDILDRGLAKEYLGKILH